MTVREFKEYIDGKPHIEKVIFWSENQDDYDIMNPCILRMSFPVITVWENPNLICLKDGENAIAFCGVTEIQMDSESSVLGDIVTVICGDGEYTYTLVIDE